MLINMRKFGGKWVLGIFSGIIMASFAFWGIGDVIRGIVSRTGLAIAVVGDVEISNPEIRREFSLQMARLQPYFALNPMYYVIEMFDAPIARGVWPAPDVVFVATAVAVSTCLVGVAVFLHAEDDLLFQL